MVRMNILLKELCKRVPIRNGPAVVLQNILSASCLELYCGKNGGRHLSLAVQEGCHHSPWSSNVNSRVMKRLSEGRRATALSSPSHHKLTKLTGQSDEHSLRQREDLGGSNSLDRRTTNLHPPSSQKNSLRNTNRRGTGSHFCIADQTPAALNNKSDRCLRCKGTFQKLTEVSEINVTLAGCGFLGTYYIGVHEVLKKNGSRLFTKIRRWGGASAGAISAALITCYPDNPWIGLTVAQNIVAGIRKKLLGVLSPSFNLSKVLHTQLEKHLPNNAHRLANGNLYISVTDCAKFQNEIITEFATREELIEAVLCSCYIPLYSGLSSPAYNGKKYMDGGLTQNLPVYPFSGATIFVSPFSGCQHICPEDENWYSFFLDVSGHRFKMNSQNIRRGLNGFLTPSEDTFMKYYEAGVRDATMFLKRNDCYEETELYK